MKVPVSVIRVHRTVSLDSDQFYVDFTSLALGRFSLSHC